MPGESLPAGTVPFATVREDEGLTVVIEQQPSWEPAGDDAYRAITIGAHSRLRAVGFTAVVARKLADNDIPANVIAGYYHDHVLVPAASANRAMMLLRELSYLG